MARKLLGCGSHDLPLERIRASRRDPRRYGGRGPIAASIPIGLVAITEGSREFVIAIVVYTIIQAVEGFVITPLVQRKVVHLPPVVTLASEVLMGMVFGAVGVIISVPLAAALLVLVRMLWIEGMLERSAARLEPPHGVPK